MGKGKFAEVRSAKHKITNKIVAVKTLNKTIMTEKQLERARCEIETLKLCQHPNIMSLYEIFENSEYIYLVLEHLSGGDLYSYLTKKHNLLSEKLVCKFVYSIGNAIYYMHSLGIIHRDIKPDNVVLISTDESSDVKIVDFGLAILLGRQEYATDCVGTLCYTAPEILEGDKYDKSVDMWSLGVLTYLLLVGELPFNHPTKDHEIVKY